MKRGMQAKCRNEPKHSPCGSSNLSKDCPGIGPLMSSGDSCSGVARQLGQITERPAGQGHRLTSSQRWGLLKKKQMSQSTGLNFWWRQACYAIRMLLRFLLKRANSLPLPLHRLKQQRKISLGSEQTHVQATTFRSQSAIRNRQSAIC